MSWNWWLITGVGYLATLFLIRWVLLTPRRQPTSSVAWILAILTLPIVGGLMFLVFGINRVDRRVDRKRAASRAILRLLPPQTRHVAEIDPDLEPLQHRLMKLANRVCHHRPLQGNRIEVMDDTNRTFGAITEAIREAQETIHLEYYIWQPDKSGTQLRDLLIKKAEEGVKIRFLYDAVGSMWLRRRFLRAMSAAGIHVAAFMQGKTIRERWSINLRNHRKIVVVDGRVGFTGGMNIGDEYLGRDKQLGYWRDTHLCVHGPCVAQLQSIFAEDWYYATGEELVQPALFPVHDEGGQVLAQVIDGEPRGVPETFLALFFAAITEATREIVLTTSYFVPPESLLVALEDAALAGVRVRVLVPSRAAHQWTVWAARSYYQSLLDAGVEIYEYQRGQLHSKTLAVDGRWAFIGTPNFDFRSLSLNFEVGVVCYDRRVSDQLADQFERDLEFSQRITAEGWRARPNRTRLLQNFCRLFSPVL